MNFDHLAAPVTDFVRVHQGWAPLIVGLIAFGESLAVISLLIPATVIMVAVGAMIGAADLAFWPILWGAVVGATLGDWASYEFGRWVGEPAKTRWPLNRQPGVVARSEDFIKRYGVAGVFVGRFFGPLRAVVPLVAGMFGMRWIPFQVANLTSAVVWAAGLLAPGAGLLTWLQR